MEKHKSLEPFWHARVDSFDFIAREKVSVEDKKQI